MVPVWMDDELRQKIERELARREQQNPGSRHTRSDVIRDALWAYLSDAEELRTDTEARAEAAAAARLAAAQNRIGQMPRRRR